MALTYVGKFLLNMKGFYDEINPATLSGAIDVIIIQQEDGSYISSPFHVKFGKLGVIRSREKIGRVAVYTALAILKKRSTGTDDWIAVDIEINEEYVEDLHMKLGESGEAFFVQPQISITKSDGPIDGDILTRSQSGIALNGKCFVKDLEGTIVTNDGRITRSEHYSGSAHSAEEDLATSPIWSGAEDECPRLNSFKDKQPDLVKFCNHLAHIKAYSSPSPTSSDHENGSVKSPSTSSRRRKKINRRNLTRNEEESTTKETFDKSSLKSSFSIDSGLHRSRYSDPEITKKPSVPRNKSFKISSLKINLNTSLSYSENDLSNFVNSIDSSWPEAPDFPCLPPGRYKSDTELETRNPTSCSSANNSDNVTLANAKSNIKNHHKAEDSHVDKAGQNLKWRWGKLPEKKSMDEESEKGGKIKKNYPKNIPSKANLKTGIYLDDIKSGQIDPQTIATYFPAPHLGNDVNANVENNLFGKVKTNLSVPLEIINDNLQDQNSTNLDDPSNFYALSICGFSQPPYLQSHSSGHDIQISSELFHRFQLSYQDLCDDSSLFHNPNLVCRIGKKYYPWQIAIPLLTSIFIYTKPYPEDQLSSYLKLLPPVKRNINNKSSSSWFSWRSSKQQTSSSRINSSIQNKTMITTKVNENKNNRDPSLKRSTSFDSAERDNKEKNQIFATELNHKSVGHSRWIKSLRLTSEQITKLKLKEGSNDVTFSVTTQFQGTTRCASHIFLWNFDDKLVISDIDGTITKSDVLGHIFPFLGKDWSQYGVAELYSRISKNGYKFVYLSSRAIGQAPGTRGYLNSFKQNNMPLPQGPILLNPNSLLSAFHKEVIEKKPEEFKISCLKDIRALFPTQFSPFYAGFGNRITDVYAYRAVDIPISRIFTINYKGEISVDLTKTFLTSYAKLQDLADQVFPPVIKTHRRYHSEPYFDFSSEPEACDDSDSRRNSNSSQSRQESVKLQPSFSFVVKSHANDTLLEADRFSNFTFWRSPLPALTEPIENEEFLDVIDSESNLITPMTTAKTGEN
ncbi:phosphatidate phosphatase LPIN1-like isoform X3 [Gordionus sp. m RMFG-2023]|uniref:phosphatidate phosphatase LPIN1-like isoform X3 n=1 Tax=Gordionus sp. m RMFG-2023 TaxID=3053472 RepID=UPI0031FE3BD6